MQDHVNGIGDLATTEPKLYCFIGFGKYDFVAVSIGSFIVDYCDVKFKEQTFPCILLASYCIHVSIFHEFIPSHTLCFLFTSDALLLQTCDLKFENAKFVTMRRQFSSASTHTDNHRLSEVSLTSSEYVYLFKI